MQMRSERRALDKIYKRRDRYEIPDWQRQKVWTLNQKRNLIDSILRGWKLPKLYFQKTNENPDEFDVVDGQQRLTAIWEFMDGDVKLKPEQAAEFGASNYRDLPDALADAFDDYEIEYDEITNATDQEVKEYFQRLQGGLPLTSSEKLNSLHSKLRDYCVNAARNPFFAKTTVISDKRLAHFDILSKVVTIEIEGLDAGLRFEDVKKVFESNTSFSAHSSAAKRVNSTLKYLHNNFPQTYTQFRIRTIVQSIITLCCHLQQAGLRLEQNTDLKEFIDFFLKELRKQMELGQRATDQDLLAFQRTVNANIKTGARTRQSILLKHLFRRYPGFYSEVSQSPEVTKQIDRERNKLAKAIVKLIRSINEQYAAQHGSDLFKATNRTASALAELGKPLSSHSEYKDFIDGLYFVFREGIGQRLGEKLPESFRDVNDLRTMLQHDTDHGRTGKSASKRKRLAEVFQKYSGSHSPEAIDPTHFDLTQVNILGALNRDLDNLARTLT